MANSFFMGIVEVVNVSENGDCLVKGKLKGTANVGGVVAIANPGDDTKLVADSTIKKIQLSDGSEVAEATDSVVLLLIANPSELTVKTGSVIFTDVSASKSIHDEYVNALADYYIGFKMMNLSDEEFNSLTISDLGELLKIHSHFYAQNASSEAGLNKEKLESITAKFISVLVKKLLSAESILCVYSTLTQEPFMFVSTSHDSDGRFYVSAPIIRVYPKACLSAIKATYANEAFDICEIENGPDGKGIYNFFAENFYINGAMGATVIGNNTIIPAGLLVSSEDYYSSLSTGVADTLNPNLVRWLLALNQLPSPKGENEENIVRVLGKFRDAEFSKKKLLVPVQKVTSDGAYRLPLRKGRTGRQVVAAFTDLKHLRDEFGKDCEVSRMSLEELIENYDIDVNPAKAKKVGCYLNEASYERILDLRDKIV